MKIAIVHNETPKSSNLSNALRHLLKENNIEIDNENPTHIISVGGDGTLISAFHQYCHMADNVKFIAIHTGHLGFYTDWREYEVEDLVNSLLENHAESVSYPLLEMEIKLKDKDQTERHLALNEGVLKTISETFVCDLYIRDELFERFRGDGVCVSTPTGSTGYNKSVGGAVLHPNLKALQVTEIASINNNVFRSLSSPMILSPDETVTLKPYPGSDLVVTMDSRKMSGKDVEWITFRIAKEEIHFDKYKHTHFWTRVQEAFIGETEDYDQ